MISRLLWLECWKDKTGRGDKEGAFLCMSATNWSAWCCLGMEEKATESLWVRIKVRAGTGDKVVVCCRLPDR